MVVWYGFGDASGAGFGSAIVGKKETTYQVEEWNYRVQELSSNYKEFKNLLEAVCDLCTKETMSGVQLFLFTDNTMVEGCFYNGTSTSQTLFNLVLDLQTLEVIHSLHLFVIHIDGTQMIECGVDGMLQGDLDKGLLRGNSPLNFVSLHLSALD